MRDIRHIIVHCSASVEGADHNRDYILGIHKAKGFSDVGYHYIVYLDGGIVEGRPIEKVGAHVKGSNFNSVGVCYIGGLDTNRKPKDTRTIMQIHALRACVNMLQIRFPEADVLGHRDYSPDLNNDGKITSDEWMKACPCFDVKTEL